MGVIVMHNERFRESTVKSGFDQLAEKYLNSGIITPNELAMIKEYLSDKQASKNVRQLSANNSGITLLNLKKFIKTPYTDLTIRDFKLAKVALANGKNRHNKPIKTNTQMQYIKVLRAFINWAGRPGEDRPKYLDIDLIALKGISNPDGDYRTESHHDLLTPEEMADMITCQKGAKKVRNRALIAMLRATGARIGEICRMTWGDLEFNQNFVKVRIDDEKLKIERTAYVIEGFSHIVELSNEAPRRNGHIIKDSYVFTVNDRPFTYTYVLELIRKIATDAGITKRVHPHLFRKSRISQMVDDGYSDGLIRDMFWGNQATDMYRPYVQKSNKKSQKEMLARAGLETPESQTPTNVKCICGEIHGPEMAFCPKTGIALNEMGRKEVKALDDNIAATVAALQEQNQAMMKQIAELTKKLNGGDQAPAPH